MAPVLYATYNDKRWGLPPMTGSKADLAIATRLLSASDADFAFCCREVVSLKCGVWAGELHAARARLTACRRLASVC